MGFKSLLRPKLSMWHDSACSSLSSVRANNDLLLKERGETVAFYYKSCYAASHILVCLSLTSENTSNFHRNHLNFVCCLAWALPVDAARRLCVVVMFWRVATGREVITFFL